MIIIGIVLGAVLGALLNKGRGGAFKHMGIPLGDKVAALLFGVLVGLATGNVVIGAAGAAAYAIGESLGWTKWLYGTEAGMTQERWNTEPNPNNGNKPWAGTFEWGNWLPKIMGIDERKDFRKYGRYGWMGRAVLWWGPTCGAMVIAGANPMVLAAIPILSIAMPFVYAWSANSKLVIPAPGHFRSDSYIGRAEHAYGAIYGAVFGGLLLI